MIHCSYKRKCPKCGQLLIFAALHEVALERFEEMFDDAVARCSNISVDSVCEQADVRRRITVEDRAGVKHQTVSSGITVDADGVVAHDATPKVSPEEPLDLG